MARDDAIHVEGAVVEVLPNGTCLVELANGHRVLAHVAARARLGLARLAPGDRVELEMSPYDLSAGRIVLEDGTNL
jgi:translation initiation factor IF-1